MVLVIWVLLNYLCRFGVCWWKLWLNIWISLKIVFLNVFILRNGDDEGSYGVGGDGGDVVDVFGVCFVFC